MSDYRLGLIFVTASAIAWSTAGLFARLVETDTATMLVWRGVFAAAGLAAVVVALNGRGSLRLLVAMGWPGWAFALVSALGMVFFMAALRNTSVAHVAVIYATAPFLAAFVSWVALRERPSRTALGASLAALAGVAIMVGLGTEGGGFGDLLAFGMTATMAVMMVIARRHPHIPVMPAAGVSGLISALACLPFAAPLAVGGTELAILALFGLVNSAAGLAFFTLGARLLPAIETALIGALDAPLAPLWVWLAFGETPDPQTLIGGSIVFAAVAAHMTAGLLRQRSAAAVPARS
jgi:drug/metabolite transporter (DMT)-like permease